MVLASLVAAAGRLEEYEENEDGEVLDIPASWSAPQALTESSRMSGLFGGGRGFPGLPAPRSRAPKTAPSTRWKASKSGGLSPTECVDFAVLRGDHAA